MIHTNYMIRKTIFAVSTEENRPIFTGCLFEIANNKLNVVAVDGFRLAWKSKFLQEKVNNFSAVIPGRTLNEINKILLDSFDTIKIGVSKNQALFEMENFFDNVLSQGYDKVIHFTISSKLTSIFSMFTVNCKEKYGDYNFSHIKTSLCLKIITQKLRIINKKDII